MKKLLIFTVVCIPFFFMNNVLAQRELTGQEVMEKNYNCENGNDVISDMVMTLINRNGDQRVRKLTQYLKENPTGEKKIIFFRSPADVKNTSFMSVSYDDKTKEDDQWIYLPALKKIKRISSESKSEYLMGSDFTYDDFGDRLPNEDVHKLLRTEVLDGETCYVVESIPKDKSHMYSKTISWVIKDKWLFMKREFHDREGKLLKIDYTKKIEEIDGILTITHRLMDNRPTAK